MCSQGLSSAKLHMSNAPFEMEAEGEIDLFQIKSASRIKLQLQHDKDPKTKEIRWMYGIGLAVHSAPAHKASEGRMYNGTYIRPRPLNKPTANVSVAGNPLMVSDVLPSVTGLDWVQDGSAIFFVFADMPKGFSFAPQKNTKPIVTQDGISFGMVLILSGSSGSTLRTIHEWTRISSLSLVGSVNLMEHKFEAKAEISMDWTLGPVTFSNAQLYLKSDGLETEVGISVTILVKVHKHESVPFTGAIFFRTMDLGIEARMLDDWEEPFGIKGLTLEACMLKAAWTPPIPLPSLFQISGGVRMGSGPSAWEGSVALSIDSGISTGIPKFAFGISFTELNLQSILCSMTTNRAWHMLVDTVAQIQLFDIDLEIFVSPVVGDTLVIGRKTFKQGIFFRGRMIFFGVAASMQMSLSLSSGLHLRADVDPFSVKLGPVKLIDFSGANGGKAFCELQIGTNVKADKINFSGQVTLLGKMKFSADVAISDQGWDMSLYAQFWEGLSLSISLVARIPWGVPKALPTDFALSAKLDISVIKHIIAFVTDNLKRIKAEMDKKFADAQEAVTNWEHKWDGKIQDLKDQIEQKHRKQSDEHRKITRLKADVTRFYNKVAHFDEWIADQHTALDHCGSCWWHPICCASHEAHIGELWVERGVAWAAYEVAEGALSVYEAAVEGVEYIALLRVEECARLHDQSETRLNLAAFVVEYWSLNITWIPLRILEQPDHVIGELGQLAIDQGILEILPGGWCPEIPTCGFS